ncbi:hypothetical protein RUM43_004925 [Polyplax serrata]|uniref:Uncharacterized protein n=1 Tax=Polyplax serrata TaxID=468196 RepID=A0AAN8XMP7_POLSC
MEVENTKPPLLDVLVELYLCKKRYCKKARKKVVDYTNSSFRQLYEYAGTKQQEEVEMSLAYSCDYVINIVNLEPYERGLSFSQVVTLVHLPFG